MKTLTRFFLCCALASSSIAQDTPLTLTVGDKTYTDAKITKTEPSAITLLHKSGIARILIRDLSPADQRRLAPDFDPQAAAAYEAQKQRGIAHMRARTNAQIAAAKDQRQAQLQADAQLAQLRKQAKPVTLYLDTLSPDKQRILARPFRIQSTGVNSSTRSLGLGGGSTNGTDRPVPDPHRIHTITHVNFKTKPDTIRAGSYVTLLLVQTSPATQTFSKTYRFIDWKGR